MFLNEKGWTLPLVLIIMVVMMLLGTALWQYSTTDLRHVAREEKKMQAYYYARSGAELLASKVVVDGYKVGNIDIPDYDSRLTSYDVSFNSNDLSENIYIELYKEEVNSKVIIISKGTVDDISETLKLEITSDGEEQYEYWERVQ